MEKSGLFNQRDLDLNPSSTTHCAVMLDRLALRIPLGFADYVKHMAACKVCVSTSARVRACMCV